MSRPRCATARSASGRGAPGRAGPGRAQLYIDGVLAAQEQFGVTTPIGLTCGGLTCGANPGSATIPDYAAPFAGGVRAV
jgi:hypothetical protein